MLPRFVKVIHDKHGISSDLVKEIVGKLADPIMIIRSTGEDARSDITVMIDLRDEHGSTFVVPVMFNDTTHGYEMNFAPSFYVKNDEKTKKPSKQWFADQLQLGNVLYANRQKVKGWNRIAKRQLPGWNSIPNTSTIIFEDELVKLKHQFPTLYQEPGDNAPHSLGESGSGRSVSFAEAERKLAKDVGARAGIVDGLKRKPGNPQRMLSQAPLVFHLLGADFREVYASPHVFDGMFPGEVRKGHNAHPNIHAGILKQLPAALADPIAVFGSDSVAGRLVFMVDVTDANGATVIIPIQLDATKNKDSALIHIVTSAYSKEKRRTEQQVV